MPVSPTRKMLLSMCSVLAWAGGRAGILTDSRQLCQPIRGKLRMCQPMTGCVWEHATSWTTESDNFKMKNLTFSSLWDIDNCPPVSTTSDFYVVVSQYPSSPTSPGQYTAHAQSHFACGTDRHKFSLTFCTEN